HARHNDPRNPRGLSHGPIGPTARGQPMTARGPYRLQERAVGASIEFRFDGRTLRGIEGDTVASALLANGMRVVSRSFKFHRPRGIFSAGIEEPNALVQVHSGARAVPIARAT